MPYNNTPIAPSNDISGQVSLPLARVQKIIAADPERTHVSKNASFAIALATEMFIQHLATTTHNVVKAERKPRRNIQYRDVSTAVAKTDNLEFLVDVVPKTTTYGAFKKKLAEKKKAEGKDGKAGEVAEGGAASATNGKGKAMVDRSGDDTESAHGSDGGIALPRSKSTITPTLAQNGNGVQARHQQAAPVQAQAQASETSDAMDVDSVPAPADSKTDDKASDDEEDGAAMQIAMEMRGPRARVNSNPSPVAAPAPQPPRHSGFTAINGSK